MKIKITNQESNLVTYIGDAEEFLEIQNYDSELEVILNTLDYTGINEVYWEELTIEKEIDLFY